MRGRDGRCGRDDFIPATPTDSAKTPSDPHLIQIKQELETMGSVSTTVNHIRAPVVI